MEHPENLIESLEEFRNLEGYDDYRNQWMDANPDIANYLNHVKVAAEIVSNYDQTK